RVLQRTRKFGRSYRACISTCSPEKAISAVARRMVGDCSGLSLELRWFSPGIDHAERGVFFSRILPDVPRESAIDLLSWGHLRRCRSDPHALGMALKSA